MLILDKVVKNILEATNRKLWNFEPGATSLQAYALSDDGERGPRSMYREDRLANHQQNTTCHEKSHDG